MASKKQRHLARPWKPRRPAPPRPGPTSPCGAPSVSASAPPSAAKWRLTARGRGPVSSSATTQSETIRERGAQRDRSACLAAQERPLPLRQATQVTTPQPESLAGLRIEGTDRAGPPTTGPSSRRRRWYHHPRRRRQQHQRWARPTRRNSTMGLIVLPHPARTAGRKPVPPTPWRQDAPMVQKGGTAGVAVRSLPGWPARGCARPARHGRTRCARGAALARSHSPAVYRGQISRICPSPFQPRRPLPVPLSRWRRASPASANFELSTDAAHGRPEEYEPSRPTEDVSPEPAAPRLHRRSASP